MRWYERDEQRPTSVTVYHGHYGCETGCCGWRAIRSDATDSTYAREEAWTFHHPDEGATDAEIIEWARETMDIPPEIEVLVGEFRVCSY